MIMSVPSLLLTPVNDGTEHSHPLYFSSCPTAHFKYCTALVASAGKSGLVAQRFASSLTSVGIPATFVHAAEWGHGDLG